MLPANVKALADLNKRFGKIVQLAALGAGPGLQKSADQLVEKMKDLAPKKTGALADSIVATPAGEQTPENSLGESKQVPKHHIYVTAGNKDVPYAVETEFGTSKEEAHPFFYPAVNEMRSDAIKANVKAAVKAAIVKGLVKSALS